MRVTDGGSTTAPLTVAFAAAALFLVLRCAVSAVFQTTGPPLAASMKVVGKSMDEPCGQSPLFSANLTGRIAPASVWT